MSDDWAEASLLLTTSHTHTQGHTHAHSLHFLLISFFLLYFNFSRFLLHSQLPFFLFCAFHRSPSPLANLLPTVSFPSLVLRRILTSMWFHLISFLWSFFLSLSFILQFYFIPYECFFCSVHLFLPQFYGWVFSNLLLSVINFHKPTPHLWHY